MEKLFKDGKEISEDKFVNLLVMELKWSKLPRSKFYYKVFKENPTVDELNAVLDEMIKWGDKYPEKNGEMTYTSEVKMLKVN